MAQWFGPKEPGFEMGVRSWKGWLALAVFIALFAATRLVPLEWIGLPQGSQNLASLGVVLIFLSVVYFNYERE